jgi:hypothetical protein
MPIPDELSPDLKKPMIDQLKTKNFKESTRLNSLALPYNSSLRRTPGESIFGGFS